MDKNLTIRILGSGPTFEVTAETDNSSAKGTFTLPPELTDLSNLTHGVETFRAAQKEKVSDAPPPDIRALGVQLFHLLFAGDIRDLLTQALATAETGVRIRLNITANDDAAALAAMPWEILTPAGVDDAPLAFGRKTVLVRSIDVTDESTPLAFEPPLRILFVVSNPTGTPTLNLTAERDHIIEAFGGEPRGVSFGATVRATRDAIADALASANPRYHVVHFMGHGDFDPATGRGAVLLEHEDGSADRVDGQQLRYLLERSNPQLVFLNACKTATTGARGAMNPFGGVAAALLAGGIPAVLAMQFPISDKAAIKFASTFYKRVASGMPVDKAVAEGRALLYDGTDSEWATPVLYLRPRSGVIFDVVDVRATALDRPTPAAGVAARSPAADVPVLTSTPPMGVPAARTIPTDAPAAAGQSAARLTPSAALVAMSGEGGPSPFRIFLANTAVSATFTQRMRPQLIRDLGAKGIEVLPAVPSQDNPAEFDAGGHEARVRELAISADLFVHIFNETAGDLLDGADATSAGGPSTFPVRQLQLGAQLQKAQLVLVNDAAAVDAASDYGKFLAQLEQSDRNRDELEFHRERTTRMADAIAERRDVMLAARARAAEAAQQVASTAELSAYVDVHKDDLDEAQPLIDYLESKGVRVEVRPTVGTDPSAAANPGQAEERFRKFVRTYPTVILFYGKVGAQWITSRYLLAFQQKVIEQLPTNIGLYIGAPEKSDKELQFANLTPMAKGIHAFDAAAVDALLAGRRA